MWRYQEEMVRSNLILTLAKVVIAAAWADGEVSHDEINSLKDLLFHLPDITGREWRMLEMYIEAPVGASERARLVEQLQSDLRSSADKALAMQALDDLVKADGVVTETEKAVVSEIKTSIEAADTSVLGQMSRLLRGPVDRRLQATAEGPNREQFFEDFIKNKVYYGVQRRLETEQRGFDIPEENLRKLSLAGGLMARVAHVDQELTEDEFEQMVRALQTGWSLPREAAAFVAEVAISEVSADLDYYRLTRGFFDNTTMGERIGFIDVMFSVAAADGFVTHAEIEEIRNISNSLKMTHKQFIDAKLKIPRKQRAG
jgi:uncharacterized tellurite resistance protein B-like protein